MLASRKPYATVLSYRLSVSPFRAVSCSWSGGPLRSPNNLLNSILPKRFLPGFFGFLGSIQTFDCGKYSLFGGRRCWSEPEGNAPSCGEKETGTQPVACRQRDAIQTTARDFDEIRIVGVHARSGMMFGSCDSKPRRGWRVGA